MNFNSKFRASSCWVEYSEIVVPRLITGVVFVCLLAAVAVAGKPDANSRPADQFFSGIVAAKSANSLTVTRSILGKDPVTRTFVLAPETKIDGRLRVKVRVTVRFVTAEEGDRAVHIVVRSPQKKESK